LQADYPVGDTGRMSGSPLTSAPVMAFVATTDPARARGFYEGVLGLRLASDELPFALVFDAHGTMLRVTAVRELAPAQYTVLGWRVADIGDAVRQMAAAGVQFERYNGMNQDEQGVWKSPGGARVAWFKDPDANTLSLTQF